jgi:hypothetical protein
VPYTSDTLRWLRFLKLIDAKGEIRGEVGNTGSGGIEHIDICIFWNFIFLSPLPRRRIFGC